MKKHKKGSARMLYLAFAFASLAVIMDAVILSDVDAVRAMLLS